MEQQPIPRIELYVRSLLPDGAHERQETVIERLQEFSQTDRIEGFSVIAWGKQIAPESAAAATEEGRYILNRIAEFKQWALSNTVSLESFYQRRTVASEASDGTYRAIRLPVMGMAEYVGDELRHVAPCTSGDVVHTIVKRLDQIESGVAMERGPGVDSVPFA
ncbi:HTH domain-containing protein [Haloarculaceae archaeon H-GB2-1]|nr:hypothetical protein [Haloarculaceae archaeon H-GB1-1]MEA5408837.1 HTH domain-containing protein [Haloarculaceae archaeon H-GB2-1]